MKLVPVQGFVRVVADLERVDPDAARLLMECSLFDYMAEGISKAEPSLDRDLAEILTADNNRARRALVKSFVAKRMAGEPVTDVLRAAAELTLIDGEIAKADPPEPDTPGEREWTPSEHPRDRRGMFRRIADAASALTGTPADSPYKARAHTVLSNSRYQNINAAGLGLQQLGLPGTGVAGSAAQLYGSLDTNDRKKLHNHIRRTAYRYRGTEKTPDKTLHDDVDLANGLVGGINSGKAKLAEAVMSANDPSNMRGQDFQDKRIRQTRPQGPNADKIIRFNGYQKQNSPDQRLMDARADITTAYLLKHLPNAKQTELSLAAGRTPPSIGVMIDADGDVVSESQGFNGDHFLPFDLKGLKRVEGGQYIRTRAVGGPTTEDIYTGLLSGARQMTVVSNSGVFTVEFDPNLRGGRRYNDKAIQMVERYARLLQVVKDSGVKNADGTYSERLLRNDISPEEKRKLRDKALGQSDGTSADATTIYNRLLDRERVKATFTSDDEDGHIDEEAHRRAIEELGSTATRQQIGRLSRDLGHELRREEMDTRPGNYQLNGEGYESALKSLQEEFPFFIRRTNREKLEDFVTSRDLDVHHTSGADVRSTRASDKGYLRRGQTTLTNALSHTTEAPEAATETTRAVAGGTGTTPASGTGVNSMLTNLKIDEYTGTQPLKLDLSKNTEARDDAANALIGMHNNVGNAFRLPGVEIQRGDGEWASVASGPAEDLIWWMHAKFNSNYESALLDLQKQPGSVQDQVRQKFKQLEAGKPDGDYVGDARAEAAATEIGKHAMVLVSILDRVNPFASDAKMDTLPGDKPIDIPAVNRLGAVKVNYVNARKHLEDTPVGNYLAMSPDAVKAELTNRIREYRKIKDAGGRPVVDGVDRDTVKDVNEQGEKSKLYKDIVHLQTARTFLYAEAIAKKTDKTPDADPNQPAPAVGQQAASPTVGFAAPGQAGTMARSPKETIAMRYRPRRVSKSQPRLLPDSHPLAQHVNALVSNQG